MARTRNRKKKDIENGFSRTNEVKKVCDNTASELKSKTKNININHRSTNSVNVDNKPGNALPATTTKTSRVINPLSIEKRSSKVSSVKRTKMGCVVNPLNDNKRTVRKRTKEAVNVDTDKDEQRVLRTVRKRTKEPVNVDTDEDEEPLLRTVRKRTKEPVKMNSRTGSTKKATKRTHEGINDETDDVPEAPLKKKYKKRSEVWHHFEECLLMVDGVEARYAKCRHCIKFSHKKAHEQIEEIKLQLKDVPGKISITMDCWTSKNVLSFLVIRARWISSEWELKTQLLDFFPIEKDHSGENLCKIFLKCISRFNIPLSKILAYTMDNATNNDTFIIALKKHGIEIGVNVSAEENQVRCLAHIFNLAVQDMLKVLKVPFIEADNTEDEFIDDSEDELEDEDVENEEENAENDDEENVDEAVESEEEKDLSPSGRTPTEKLRKLVRKIRKSTKLRRELRKLCIFYEVRPLVPINDVSIRWNSTYKMILRAKHLRVPLGALCLNEKSLQSLRLVNSEWDDLKDIEVFLQKFDRATQMISMERHSTFASYLPTMNWLLDYLAMTCQNEVGLLSSVAAVGLDKLTKYSLSVNDSKLPYIATLLNPALKLDYFKEHRYNRTTIDNINETLSDYFSQNYETGSDTAENANELKDELYAHIYKRSTNENVSKELERYLSLPLSPPKVSDTLAFWKAQEGELSCMSKMARDVLAVHTTSVAVERDNSAGADVVTSSRCSLKGVTVEASMCLQRWLID